MRSTRWFVSLAGALALVSAGCLPPGPRDMERNPDRDQPLEGSTQQRIEEDADLDAGPRESGQTGSFEEQQGLDDGPHQSGQHGGTGTVEDEYDEAK